MTPRRDLRLDVTGLRAVAVAAVVAYHLWPTAVSGGFIGVDVFFVVSGFVVCRAYLHRAVIGDVLFSSFFWRRIRRLLPALMTVLLVTTCTAVAILRPPALLEFGEVLLAQVFYAQNFVLWWQGDYFSNEMRRPLLHTWSLGVEEQFYLLFPVLVLLVRRAGTPRRQLAALSIVAIVSLIAALFGRVVSPKTVFFLAPFRAWEFLAGVIVLRLEGRLPARMSIAGLALLCVSFFAFDESALFPGVHACIALMGTCLVLAGRSGAVSRILASPVLCWVGDRSYSIYLWHWPLIVFAFVLDVSFAGVTLVILLVSAALADVTFRMIEEPVRRGLLLGSHEALRRFALGSLVGIGLAATLLVVFDGFPERFREPAGSLFRAGIKQNDGRCGMLFGVLPGHEPACLVGVNWGQRGLLIVGDSHADMVDEAFGAEGDRLRRTVFLSDTACDLWKLVGDVFRCGDQYREELIAFAVRHEVDTVLFMSSYGDFTGEHEAQAHQVVSAFLGSGLKVVVTGPLPFGAVQNPSFRAEQYLADPTYQPKALSVANHAASFGAARAFLLRTDATVVQVDVALCGLMLCRFEESGVPLYFDEGHVSSLGAQLIVAHASSWVWRADGG